MTGKRRKIKCIYLSDDHSICTPCMDKGTNCLSQEYVEHALPPNVADSALDHRMAKVETLLESLMKKVSQTAEGSSILNGSVNTPIISSTLETTNYSQPSASLFSSDVPGPQPEPGLSMLRPHSTSVLSPSTLANHEKGGLYEKTDNLRQRLVAMLPCQADVDRLAELSSGWWLIRRHMMPYLLTMPDQEYRKQFDVSTVSGSHPVAITRLLLCVALCVQQLPPDVDLHKLQTAIPLRDLEYKITTFITTSVTSDDELIGSLEGIECLILQGIYQVNAGNLRRSWLAFRKAIDVAQLIGLHRIALKTSQDSPDAMEARRHYMWFRIMQGV